MKHKISNSFISVVVDSFGAELASIKYNNIEYLWQKNAEYWGSSAPVLFPICGSLRKDQAIINGNKTCHMPRHGIVRKRNFDVVEKDENSIMFKFSADNDTMALYPYDFTLYITYRLHDTTIQVQYTIGNNTNQEMPYFIGGHPDLIFP